MEPKRSGPCLHEHTRRMKYSVVCAAVGVTPSGLEGSDLPLTRHLTAPRTLNETHTGLDKRQLRDRLHHILCRDTHRVPFFPFFPSFFLLFCYYLFFFLLFFLFSFLFSVFRFPFSFSFLLFHNVAR